MKLKFFLVVSIILFAAMANAYDTKNPVKIIAVSVYDDGRIFFKTDPRETGEGSNCKATSGNYYGDFFFYDTAPGADYKMSLLLSALVTNQNVGLHYTANTNGYCEVSIIQIQQ